jgi:putative transposase
VATTADGTEVARFEAPRPLQHGLARLRRLSRQASRTQPRSRNRAKATRRLSRQHARIADVRRTFLHGVSSQLVKTHDRLSLEDLAVANLAAWAERSIAQAPDRQAGGRVINAPGGNGADRRLGDGGTDPVKGEPTPVPSLA